MDEDALANAILHRNKTFQEFPTLICGHSHEPRDRSRFRNTQGILPPKTKDRNLFTRYMNTGSAGRFANLIWCIEIVGGTARVYSWSNSGTEKHLVKKKVSWESNDNGKLIGKEVDI